jgi:hypothetical protein
MALVSATVTLRAPTAGNYSGTFTFNCTQVISDVVNATNATLYYNSSGGAIISVAALRVVTVVNDTVDDLNFDNITTNIAGLTEGTAYNFSCVLFNGSTQTMSAGVSSITIDNTAPAVSSVNILNNGNYSGSIVLNFSINGSVSGIGGVFFNVTNSSGGQNATYTASQQGSTLYWNATLNTAHFTGTTYNITVFANDTAGNLNSTTVLILTFNNTAPSVTPSVGSITSSGGTLSVTTDEAVASCNYSGDVTGSLSGSGISWSVSIGSLTSSTSYALGVSCTDFAGNSGAGSVSFTTSSADSSGGTTTVSFWKKTSTVTDVQFADGHTKKLEVKSRLRFRVDNSNHYVGVIALTSTTATLNVSSTPQQETFSIGDEEKFDVTDDGYYDIKITLNSIESDEADITIIKIHEEVPTPPASCTPNWDCTAWSACTEGLKTRDCSDINSCGTSVGKPAESEACEDAAAGGKTSIIIIIIVIVVIAAAVLFYIFVYKKKRYFKKGI